MKAYEKVNFKYKYIIMKRVLLLLGFSFFAMSCASSYIHSSPSEFVDSGKAVSATKKNVSVLGLSPIDIHKVSGNLLRDLNKKCGAAGVENIRTTVTVTPYPFVLVEKMHASGTCKK